MSMVATRAGRALCAKVLKGEAPAGGADWRVRLFTNDFNPTTTSVLADFTEATFDGYAEVATTPADTTGPTLVGEDQVMRVKGESLVWDCAADPETIRGWLLYDEDSGDVLFAEKYAVPHVLEVGSRHTLFLDIAQGACG